VPLQFNTHVFAIRDSMRVFAIQVIITDFAIRMSISDVAIQNKGLCTSIHVPVQFG